jgi:hypothetical protein
LSRNKDYHWNSFKKRKLASNGKSAHHAQKKGKSNDGLKPDSECPIHGGYTWKKCFNNPSGES